MNNMFSVAFGDNAENLFYYNIREAENYNTHKIRKVFLLPTPGFEVKSSILTKKLAISQIQATRKSNIWELEFSEEENAMNKEQQFIYSAPRFKNCLIVAPLIPEYMEGLRHIISNMADSDIDLLLACDNLETLRAFTNKQPDIFRLHSQANFPFTVDYLQNIAPFVGEGNVFPIFLAQYIVNYLSKLITQSPDVEIATSHGPLIWVWDGKTSYRKADEVFMRLGKLLIKEELQLPVTDDLIEADLLNYIAS